MGQRASLELAADSTAGNIVQEGVEAMAKEHEVSVNLLFTCGLCW